MLPSDCVQRVLRGPRSSGPSQFLLSLPREQFCFHPPLESGFRFHRQLSRKTASVSMGLMRILNASSSILLRSCSVSFRQAFVNQDLRATPLALRIVETLADTLSDTQHSAVAF